MQNAPEPFLSNQIPVGWWGRNIPSHFSTHSTPWWLVSYYVVSPLPYNNVISSDLYINIGFHPCRL